MVKKLLAYSGAIAVLGIAFYALSVALKPPALPPGFLYGNGQIEGTEVGVSAEVTGRVTESTIVEGKPVKDGDVLVRLDDSDLKAQLAQAEAEVAALQQEQAGVRGQIEIWEHHLQTARVELARYLKLRETQTITPQQLDQVSDRAREAEGQVTTLKAQASRENARVEAARRRVDWLALQIEKTTIEAPIDGTILVKAIELGELASVGRVIAVLVDLSDLELKIYIPESDIGRVRLNDAARVQIDAFPGRTFDARVKRIDERAQFTPKDIHMPEERSRLVFGVTLALDNRDGYLKPGMPADAWVRSATDAPWPELLKVPR